MAKTDDQATVGGIRLHTAQPGTLDQEPRIENPIKVRGVGLHFAEWAELDRIAGELNMTAHGLAVWALRDFIKRYNAGEIKTKQTKKLA